METEVPPTRTDLRLLTRGHVRLHYVVRRACDAANLLYDIDAAEMDRETRERLSLYLRQQ